MFGYVALLLLQIQVVAPERRWRKYSASDKIYQTYRPRKKTLQGIELTTRSRNFRVYADIPLTEYVYLF